MKTLNIRQTWSYSKNEYQINWKNFVSSNTPKIRFDITLVFPVDWRFFFSDKTVCKWSQNTAKLKKWQWKRLPHFGYKHFLSSFNSVSNHKNRNYSLLFYFRYSFDKLIESGSKKKKKQNFSTVNDEALNSFKIAYKLKSKKKKTIILEF